MTDQPTLNYPSGGYPRPHPIYHAPIHTENYDFLNAHYGVNPNGNVNSQFSYPAYNIG
jgi:hypothetical protein